MVLRRVMSGWLIALAALARSLAAALERAAAERSGPAIDPVMAELRERYPDAPAHWLAFMAERMSAEAETIGSAAPALGTPVAWTSVDGRGSQRTSPGEPSPAPSIEPPARDGSDAPAAVSRPSVARRGEAAAIPSMAELASRSTEIWRGPSARPKRPSRPVFAAPVDRSSSPAPVLDQALDQARPPRAGRPRSPLAVAPRAPLPAALGETPGAAPSERPLEAPADDTVSAAPSRHDFSSEHVSSERADAGPPPARRTLATRFEVAQSDLEPGLTALPRFAEAGSAAPRMESVAPVSPSESKASVSRVALAVSLSEDPGRSPQEPASLDSTRAAERCPASSSISSPTAKRSITRRMIDSVVASIRRKPPLSDITRAAPVVRPPSQPVLSKILERSSHPSSRPTPPPVHGAKGVVARGNRAAPPPLVPDGELSVEVTPPPARRDDRATTNMAWVEPVSGPAGASRRRPFAFASRRPSSDDTTGQDTATDNRWPSLPPSSPALALAVEAPPPHWSRLAHDQEEGLWNA